MGKEFLMDVEMAIKEYFRPELKVRPDIIEREKTFNEQDPNRKTWMLQHTYLCEGDLNDLKHHPDYHDGPLSVRITQFATNSIYNKIRPHKKVIAGVPLGSNSKQELEEKLKEQLWIRGSNAGINYRVYKKGNCLVGEVTPAELSRDL